MNGMADIVKNWFFSAAFSHSIYHPFYKIGHFLFTSSVMWFIAYFKSKDVWIIFIGQTCVRIDMIQKLKQIILLRFNGYRICKAIVFAVFMGKSRCVFIGFRPAVSPKSDGSYDSMNTFVF